jgi:acyl carrier protein
MNPDRQTFLEGVLHVLCTIAPEVEPDAIAPAQALRRQVDLDSMDWLNFLVGLHTRFGVNIPEVDYARLVSLNDVVDYLQHAPAT